MRCTTTWLLIGAACGGCVIGPEDAEDPDLDARLLDELAAYRVHRPVNTQPFASTLGPFDVNCYVTGDVNDYARIHPEQSGSRVTLAHGTMIVREVLAADGTIDKLTVMAKGPPGFDPSFGDWWFAVTDAHARPTTKDGLVLVGRLPQCHACHDERAQDDFLFGIPLGESR